GAQKHEAFPRDRRHVDELLLHARQVPPPELAAGLGGQREGVRVGGAVDAAVGDGEPVRTVVPGVVAARPAQRSGRAVEREDVAAQVLDVDGVVVDDRIRREDAGEARLGREAKAPAHPQPADVAGVEARFLMRNSGTKVHSFTLGSTTTKRGTGKQTGFSSVLKPKEQKLILIFMDYRGPLPYRSTLKHDLGKPGMRGVFTIR